MDDRQLANRQEYEQRLRSSSVPNKEQIQVDWAQSPQKRPHQRPCDIELAEPYLDIILPWVTIWQIHREFSIKKDEHRSQLSVISRHQPTLYQSSLQVHVRLQHRLQQSLKIIVRKERLAEKDHLESLCYFVRVLLIRDLWDDDWWDIKGQGQKNISLERRDIKTPKDNRRQWRNQPWKECQNIQIT